MNAPTGPHFAYLDFQTHPQAESIRYFSRGEWPVMRLIQGIYDLEPAQARRILRARIYSNVTPSEAELAMVKVAAKRLSAPVAFLPNEKIQYLEVQPASAPIPLRDENLPAEIRELLDRREFMRAALGLARQIPRRAQLYESDRPVAALLVDREGRLIGAAVNSNAQNRTRHAEMNLIQGLLGDKPAGTKILPRGSRIYVTLKCCKMCAALIWCAAENASEIRVLYAQDDPGPNARSTVLTPFSLERKRIARSDQELALEIESADISSA